MIQVAALYVLPTGPYTSMHDVDAWSEARDARRYAGPYPVVAHPPCARWGRLRGMATQDTADCGIVAAIQVRQWGGVLEHPAGSTLWEVAGLPEPGAGFDDFGGRTMHVKQSRWGHPAPKETWLYLCRVEPLPLPPEVPDPAGRVGDMSRFQREVTPPLLARWLVDVAKTAQTRRQ